jgi:hypothetical protein
VRTKILIADIKDEVLVGIDVLADRYYGPFDVSFNHSCLVVRGEKIPFMFGPSTIHHARAAKDYVIPALTEMLIHVDADAASVMVSRVFLLESEPAFVEKTGIIVAPCVTNIGEQTLTVRVMNPHKSEQSIKQGQVVCRVECVTVEQTLLNGETDVAKDSVGQCTVLHSEQADRNMVCHIPAHLEELYNKASVGKTRRQSEQIYDFLCEYESCFSKNETDLGLTNVLEHEIRTDNARPIKQAPRRTPLAFADDDRNALVQLQERGTIRPSTSPWASPIVLVRKRTGATRLCVDYRKLNKVTVKDAFPLPRVADCLDSLAGSVLFSTFDITAAYHQVPVKREDIPKTAFVTKYGLFEFLTMPFGLCNAPGTFQRLMEIVLNGLQWSTCLIYLDDVIIYGRTFDEHMTRLRDVLDRVKNSGLKLSPPKCHLLEPEVRFLGHIVTSAGTRPDPDNVRKLLEWPTPTCATDVRGILGLANYYRKYIQDFAKRVNAMTALTRKHQTFVWSEQCEHEFCDIKNALVGSDVMAYPTANDIFILDTDASQRGLGAVLSQRQEGQERVIAYGSKTLNKCERNYCITDKELLAVKHFILQYKHYLLGRKFVVRTDHAALKWLLSLREPKGRISRWIELLSEFNFEIEFRAGQKHGNADAMSRYPDLDEVTVCDLPCGGCAKCVKRDGDMCGRVILSSARDSGNVEPARVVTRSQAKAREQTTETYPPGGAGVINNSPSLAQPRDKHQASPASQPFSAPALDNTGLIQFSPADIQRAQREDADIKPLIDWLQSDDRPEGQIVSRCSRATRHYWHNWKLLKMRNNILYRKCWNNNGVSFTWQLIVPQKLKRDVMFQMHDSILSGHLGQRKTREKIRQKFYWFAMRDDVNVYVAQCDVCASIKLPTKTPRAPLGSMQVGSPLDRLATDIMGPLPVTPRGNKYILVVTDWFTKWVEVFPVPDFTAKTCARLIVNEVIGRYGCPIDIHSDQGRNYESILFYELCRMLEIRKTRTAPYNPKCNGQTERFNKTLIRMIKSYLHAEQTDWDLDLGCLAAAYRATVNETTGFTPNFLMFGREVRLPGEVMFGAIADDGEDVTSYGGYVDRLRQQMQQAHEIAREHISGCSKRHKDVYDGKTLLFSYRPGDLVWVLSEIKQLNWAPKLRRPYEGPYLVVWKLSDADYVIQTEKNGKTRVLNHNLLKPYEGRVKLSWANIALKKAKAVWDGR